jgi:acetyl-CoA synthetase
MTSPFKPLQSFDEYKALYARAAADPEAFWLEQAAALQWITPPTSALQTADMRGGDFSWFSGGRLNASLSCVDRHAQATPDKTAIIWVGDEPNTYQHITFATLRAEVCRMANALLEMGVRRGDRVCIYLPMIPEAAYAMLACARIGAVHSVVFAGFSADSLRDRIVDATCKVIITADEGVRGGRKIPLKATTDRAVEGLSCVHAVLVARRTHADVHMTPGRDHWLDEVTARQRGVCPAEPMDAEDPLFILYTSGSTGKPKGVLHTTGGYLTYAAYTHRLVFGLRPDDIHFCAADVGWVTGHSYIVYGPLANGVTTVMFESTPLYPNPGRYWQTIDDIGATIFYTAPTALRAIAREGNDWVTCYSRASVRVLGTVGEPINPEVWQWYHDVVGEGRCAVVDTWWQTETGGVMISPIAGVTPPKAGSATLPLPGIFPALLNHEGHVVEGNGVEGNLCIQRPWPGQARTVYGDHARFVQTYFSAYEGYYFTGDGCRRDVDGDYWITGRVDDVLNVAGHRLGTAEIESALVSHEAVAEAAVVGFPHDIKGIGVYAFVIINAEYADWDEDELHGALKQQVRQAISPIATPDVIQITPGLPKTRSGKIMRRILRKIASDDLSNLGDISTLADPDIVQVIIQGKHAKA